MAIYRNQTGTVETKDRKTPFYDDVVRGLSTSPKFLQSKYFYDAEGDRLFQQIMASPEYYLTNCEHEIFSKQTGELVHTILDRYHDFDVVELGAGDATKSVHLLQYLVKLGFDFTYYPVDISGNVIQQLKQQLPAQVPGLQLHGLNGEYIDMIKALNNHSQKRKLVLFLGSNIGNFTPEEAVHFLRSLQQSLLPGDLLLMGVDLKKNPKQVLAAYNDSEGVTRQFNLNLLHRINRELDANFDVTAFDHFPIYNPVTGACRSYLISLKDQHVQVGGRLFRFYENEPVYMELSQKYSVAELDAMALQAGFVPVDYFYDQHRWFVDVIWEKR